MYTNWYTVTTGSFTGFGLGLMSPTKIQGVGSCPVAHILLRTFAIKKKSVGINLDIQLAFAHNFLSFLHCVEVSILQL